MNNHNKLLNDLIDDYLTSISNDDLKSSCSYILKNCGKGLRFGLMIASFEYFNLSVTNYANLALALEMIHNYSLIHDDLPSMDNDDMRRNKPTLHKVYGEAMAILTGDTLLTDSFKILSSVNIEESQVFKAVVGEFSTSAGSNGMIKGQVEDIKYQQDNVNLKTRIAMYENKTGKLFSLALTIPAIISKVPNVRDFQELGKLIGICFQLKDDLDDYQKEALADFKEIQNTLDFYQHESNKLIDKLYSDQCQIKEILNKIIF